MYVSIRWIKLKYINLFAVIKLVASFQQHQPVKLKTFMKHLLRIISHCLIIHGTIKPHCYG